MDLEIGVVWTGAFSEFIPNRMRRKWYSAFAFDCLFISRQFDALSRCIAYQIAAPCEWLAFRSLFQWFSICSAFLWCNIHLCNKRWVIYANIYICQYVLRLQVNKFLPWLRISCLCHSQQMHEQRSQTGIWSGTIWAYVVNRTPDLFAMEIIIVLKYWGITSFFASIFQLRYLLIPRFIGCTMAEPNRPNIYE